MSEKRETEREKGRENVKNEIDKNVKEIVQMPSAVIVNKAYGTLTLYNFNVITEETKPFVAI